MAVRIPSGENALTVEANGRRVALTNLKAIVMKRYPDGVSGKFFYMKRALSPRPTWGEVRGRFDLASYPRTAHARV